MTIKHALLFLILLANTVHGQTTISFDNRQPMLEFAVKRLEAQFPLHRLPPGQQANIMIRTTQSLNLSPEGFRLSRQNGKVTVSASGISGAMYGTLDLAEQLSMGKTISTITEKIVNPHFTVRAIKFNLPWSSYRTGPAMTQHAEICRDLVFWQAFLDQMALNRFNVLSLWNVHPFSFMVKPTHFPEANPFSEKEMMEWKAFWTSLFRMAKERGIETFIVNWNIAVSPEFASHYHVLERNDTAAIVKQYTREVVTQVINEYPDLSGIGITLADWMSNFRTDGSTLPEMTPMDREDWIEETVVAGIKAANRPVKFLHRSVLSSDPSEMRRVINNANLRDTTLVEIKFNWSHGHSTPALLITHDSHSGAKDDGYWNPMPVNYRVEWMIRNEDFFILRWGQHAFMRDHIALNSKPYVNGYFVGSEGYIPAKDFSHLPGPHISWKYAFEKQWLFYKSWGRLLFDPSTPDEIFENEYDMRYGRGIGKIVLAAQEKASRMPLRLASYFRATWDYTLYSEGFLSPSPVGGLNDKVSAFISIDELIDHTTLNPELISVKDYVQSLRDEKSLAGHTTPLMLADSLEADALSALATVHSLRSSLAPGTLACEADDIETWAWLSRYFADKLRAAVALELYRVSGEKAEKDKSIALLKKCRAHWSEVCKITGAHYREVPYIDDQSDAKTFSWTKFMPQVERDIRIAEEAKH